MSIYQESIKAATGCPDADLDEIEEYMRHVVFHSTLDWQTARQLKTGARDAWSDIQWIRSPEGIAYVAEIEKQYIES